MRDFWEGPLQRGNSGSFPFLPLLLLMTQEQTGSLETHSVLACETTRQSRSGKVCEEFLNKRKLSNLQTSFIQEHKPHAFKPLQSAFSYNQTQFLTDNNNLLRRAAPSVKEPTERLPKVHKKQTNQRMHCLFGLH